MFWYTIYKQLRIGDNLNKKIILIVIISLFITSCGFETNIDKINKLIEKGDYKRAEKIIKKELPRDENNKELYDSLLKIYDRTNRDKEKLLEEAIEKFDSIDYKRLLADIYVNKKKNREAIDIYKEIVKEDKSLENYRKILKLYRKENRTKEFLGYFESEREHIKDEEFILEVSLIYIDFGNEERARELVSSLNLDNIKSLREYELLAEYYYRINDFANSFKIAQEGLSLAPEETILYGYIYGFINSDGLKMQKIYNEDLNGDGLKENIILLADKSTLEAGNIILTIQNGSNGEILGKKRLEEYVGYDEIRFLDFNGDGVKDLYLSKYIKNKQYIRPEIYSFIDNDFKLLTDDYEYNDTEYSVKDGFKLEIYSRKQNKKEILDMSRDKDIYIDFGIYNKEGSYIENSVIETLDTRYKPVYDREIGKYKLKEVYDIGLEDERLAKIETIYIYDGQHMKIESLNIDSDYPIRSEKYKGETVKPIKSLGLEDLDRIFSMTKEEIFSTYGRPKKVDYINGEILDYNGIQFYMDGELVREIRILNGKDILGLNIPVSYEEIIGELGKPNEEIVGKDFVDEYEIIYRKDDLKLKFNGVKDREDSFILSIYK